MAGLASRLALGVAMAAALAAVSTADDTPGATDWPSTNYNQGANRYSPLDQITAGNVRALQQAWSFHLKPAGYTGRLPSDAMRGSAYPAAFLQQSVGAIVRSIPGVKDIRFSIQIEPLQPAAPSRGANPGARN